MSYVVIDSGSLAGVGALGVSEGPAVGGDAQARAQLASLLTATVVKWFDELSRAIDDVPFLPLSMLDVKDRLKVAREQLNSQVKPNALAVISDTSVPLAQVEARVLTFLANYHAALVGQMNLAKQSVRANTMAGQLQQLRDAFRTVVRATVREFAETVGVGTEGLTSGLPFWVLPVVALVGVAYVMRSIR